MTAPAPSPTPPAKRIYVMWGVALALLLALGLLCWLVVVPVLATQSILRSAHDNRVTPEEAVRRLGGPQRAAQRLEAYLALSNHLVEGRYKPDAACLFEYCNGHARSAM